MIWPGKYCDSERQSGAIVFPTINSTETLLETAMKQSPKSKSTAGESIADLPEVQIDSFLAKFEPENANLIRRLRSDLRKLLPTAVELVYDNYNFLVFGFCATPRASDCICSLAANANGASLCFYYGATLPDPHGILEGSGNQNRFVRLRDASRLSDPQVREILAAAIAQADPPIPSGGSGRTVIQSISAKQRPRRRVASS
jgi:hypothetical protein